MASDKKVEHITVEVPAERHTVEFSWDDIEAMIRAKMRMSHGAKQLDIIDVKVPLDLAAEIKKDPIFTASYVRIN